MDSSKYFYTYILEVYKKFREQVGSMKLKNSLGHVVTPVDRLLRKYVTLLRILNKVLLTISNLSATSLMVVSSFAANYKKTVNNY